MKKITDNCWRLPQNKGADTADHRCADWQGEGQSKRSDWSYLEDTTFWICCLGGENAYILK